MKWIWLMSTDELSDAQEVLTYRQIIYEEHLSELYNLDTWLINRRGKCFLSKYPIDSKRAAYLALRLSQNNTAIKNLGRQIKMNKKKLDNVSRRLKKKLGG